jgi:integrase
MGKQLTPKTAEQALRWIETTPHHYAAVDDEPGFFVLKGYGTKLRIPNALQATMRDLVEPSPHAHDNRMFRATVEGRKLIGFGPNGPHTHRHKKGGLYTKLMEATHSETEEAMVVYQGDDGRTWVRPKAMFEEAGRFEPLGQSDG